MTLVPEERPLPYEIPPREVEHDMPDERPDAYPVKPTMVGECSLHAWWGSKQDEAKSITELEKKDARRASLGGFGFSARRAHG